MRIWFAHIQWLWHLLWLLPLVLAIALWGSRRYRQLLRGFVRNPELASSLRASLSESRRRWRQVLWLLALVFLLLAGLRPQALPGETISRPAAGRDLLFVLDVSRSMLATDVGNTTRLEHGRQLIKSVTGRFPEARTGLIAFAGVPYVQCPMTFNRGSFHLILNDTDTRTLPVGGSNLEKALAETLRSLRAAEGPHRAVVVISDGEELQGDVSRSLARLRDMRVPVHVVGVGDPEVGSFIQLPDQSFIESDGQRVRTRLREAPLQAIARAGGGVYVRSTAAAPGLAVLSEKLQSLAPRERGGKLAQQRPRELFPWLLFPAVFLLLIRFGLTERCRRTADLPAMAGLSLFLVATVVFAAEDQRIRTLQRALERSDKAAEQVRLHYNLGRRLQELGRNQEAIRHYDAALSRPAEAAETHGRALQNLGVLLHLEGRRQLKSAPATAVEKLKKSVQHYLGALRWQPEDRESAENLALARRDLAIARKNVKRLAAFNRRREQARQQVKAAYEHQQQANQSGAADDSLSAAKAAAEQAHQLVQDLLPLAVELDRADKPKQAADELQGAIALQKQLTAPPTAEHAATRKHLGKALVLLGGTLPPESPEQGGTEPPAQNQEEKNPPPENAEMLKLLKAAEEDEKNLKNQLKDDQKRYRDPATEHRNW